MPLLLKLYKEMLIYDSVGFCVWDRNCLSEMSVGSKSKITEKPNKQVLVLRTSSLGSRKSSAKVSSDFAAVGSQD